MGDTEIKIAAVYQHIPAFTDEIYLFSKILSNGQGLSGPFARISNRPRAQGIVKFAPIFPFNTHRFPRIFFTTFRGFFTSFSVDFFSEIRGNGSERSAKMWANFFFGKLMCVKFENWIRIHHPLLKHQDTKPTLGCFWQHLWLAQLYPSAKAKNSKKN